MATGAAALKELVQLCTSIKAFGVDYREITAGADFWNRFCCTRLDMTYRPERFSKAESGPHGLFFWSLFTCCSFVLVHVFVLPSPVAVFEDKHKEIISVEGRRLIDKCGATRSDYIPL